jgi:hypothetical protein
MNENEKSFNREFGSNNIRKFIRENHWAIVSLFLCMTIILLALGFKDTKDLYAQYFLKQYLTNNNCICSLKGIKPIGIP